MRSYVLIAPEIALLTTALLVMFADLLSAGRRRASAWLGVVGSLVAAGLAFWAGTGEVTLFGGMLNVDGAAEMVRIATALLTAVFLLWVAGKGMGVGKVRHATVLVLLSSLGSILMASAQDWVVLFLAIETATMPLYVLIGYDRDDERGLEGAMKYFLLSMITSIAMLYGLSFVVGLSGTTAYAGLAIGRFGVVGLFAVVLVMAGLFAKLTAVPFHWWAPDAYAGAPASSVAFVSSVPKLAGIVAVARVIFIFVPQTPAVLSVVIITAVASMVLGNVAAYPQRDIRRLMAYSGVAHVGYVLVAFAAGSALGIQSAIFYALAYAIPSMAVMLIVADEGNDMEDLAGLGHRRPWTAAAMVALLLSLIGVPPMVGFLGKVYVFGAALEADLAWLAVVGVTMSVVSAGFYFRIVRSMYFDERPTVVPIDQDRTRAADVALGLCVAATFGLGIFAGPILKMIGLVLPGAG